MHYADTSLRPASFEVVKIANDGTLQLLYECIVLNIVCFGTEPGQSFSCLRVQSSDLLPYS